MGFSSYQLRVTEQTALKPYYGLCIGIRLRRVQTLLSLTGVIFGNLIRREVWDGI